MYRAHTKFGEIRRRFPYTLFYCALIKNISLKEDSHLQNIKNFKFIALIYQLLNVLYCAPTSNIPLKFLEVYKRLTYHR